MTICLENQSKSNIFCWLEPFRSVASEGCRLLKYSRRNDRSEGAAEPILYYLSPQQSVALEPLTSACKHVSRQISFAMISFSLLLRKTSLKMRSAQNCASRCIFFPAPLPLQSVFHSLRLRLSINATERPPRTSSPGLSAFLFYQGG